MKVVFFDVVLVSPRLLHRDCHAIGIGKCPAVFGLVWILIRLACIFNHRIIYGCCYLIFNFLGTNGRMEPVVVAPKTSPPSTKPKQTAPKRKPDKGSEENKFARTKGEKRQAAPNPGEHAIGVRLGGSDSFILWGVGPGGGQ